MDHEEEVLQNLAQTNNVQRTKLLELSGELHSSRTELVTLHSEYLSRDEV